MIVCRDAIHSINKTAGKLGLVSCSANPQYDYDHRMDKGLYLDKALCERIIGVTKSAYEQYADLAEDYAAGKFEVLTPEHYIDLLEQCLRVLPPEMVIHRLTGDGAKRDLIAPLWSADKKRVLNAIHAAFARDDLVQGSEL